MPRKIVAFYLCYRKWLGTLDIFQTFQTGISDETYDELRRILEKQNGHAYTLEETREIGDGLIDFYMTLIEIVRD